MPMIFALFPSLLTRSVSGKGTRMSTAVAGSNTLVSSEVLGRFSRSDIVDFGGKLFNPGEHHTSVPEPSLGRDISGDGDCWLNRDADTEFPAQGYAGISSVGPVSGWNANQRGLRGLSERASGEYCA